MPPMPADDEADTPAAWHWVGFMSARARDYFRRQAIALYPDRVEPREEYARYDDSGRLVTTNSAEGFFGNSKRSIDGTHHQVSPQHLLLYLAELDYKYNTRKETDGARTTAAIPKIVGKRLMLRRPTGRS